MRRFFAGLRAILLSLLFIILVTLFMAFPSVIIDFATELRNQSEGVRALLVLGAAALDVLLLFNIYREVQALRAGVGRRLRPGKTTPPEASPPTPSSPALKTPTPAESAKNDSSKDEIDFAEFSTPPKDPPPST